MASLDKEIQVLMLKGQRGRSSYEEAVEKEYFSGTLEEWIETYATPDDYITRKEFKKVTQAQYDELKRNNQLVANCYYVITDDDTWDVIETRITALEQARTSIESDIDNLQSDVSDNTDDIESLQSNSLMARSLKTSQTSDNDEEFTSGHVSFEVDNLNLAKNEKLICVEGILKVLVSPTSVYMSQKVVLILGESINPTEYPQGYYSQDHLVYSINNMSSGVLGDIYSISAYLNNGTGIITLSLGTISMAISNNTVKLSYVAIEDGYATFKLTNIYAIQQWN